MSTIIVITPHPKIPPSDGSVQPSQIVKQGKYMTNHDTAAILRAAADELDPRAGESHEAG